MKKDLQVNAECCVFIKVKEWDLIGSDDFIGEAFLPFNRIRRDSAQSEPEQIILNLSKLSQGIYIEYINLIVNQCSLIFIYVESEYLTLLENRTWDKKARDFAKREKNNKKLV